MFIQLSILKTHLVFALMCFVLGILRCVSFAAEPIQNEPQIQNLAKVSDLDLGLAYLWAQQEEQKLRTSTESDRLSGHVRRLLVEARSEIQKRGSMRAETIYDGIVSPACPRESFLSGFARVVQDGPALSINHDLNVLSGVVVRDTVLLIMPPKHDLLIGKIEENGIALIARSGDCSISLTKAANLRDAVRSGDIAAVRWVVQSRANVNESDAWGTPLHIAVVKGADEIVKLLLDAGADLERATSPNVGGQRPLHLAATHASGASIARLLIGRGAHTDARDAAGRTPLITAIMADNLEVADVLLSAGADLEAGDAKLGASPLAWAACWKRFTAAKYLLSKGAQINRKSGPDGDTALHQAVACCHALDMIKYLVAKGADVNAKNNKGLTPIERAFSKQDQEILRSLGARD
jgi:ankyrin repeat protein